MSERAVFLDRDNTIIDNDGYLGDPSKVRLLPGAAAALTSLRSLGYRLIVVSNQSGVARGMYKEADVEAVNDEMSRQLREKAGAYIDASYYCPFHPEAPLPEYRIDHDWRKPKPGMLRQAAADFGLDLSQCWMVGDQWRDVAAGTAVGCRTILLRDPERKDAGGEEAEVMNATVTPSFVVRSLTDAARIIVREGRHAPPPPAPPPSPVTPPPEEPQPRAFAPAVVASPPISVVLPAPSPPPMPPPPPPPPPPLDEAALADRLAERLARPMAGSPIAAAATAAPGPADTATLEKHLDELVVQLRQQNRNADLRPDFSLSHIIILIVECFAVVAMVIGFFKYFTMNLTYKTAQDLQFASMSHLQALIWIMAAVFFQGIVIALLVYSRNK
jgi:histidinol-phosphate phosphatase family protein